jgi:hypothetical protein
MKTCRLLVIKAPVAGGGDWSCGVSVRGERALYVLGLLTAALEHGDRDV